LPHLGHSLRACAGIPSSPSKTATVPHEPSRVDTDDTARLDELLAEASETRARIAEHHVRSEELRQKCEDIQRLMDAPHVAPQRPTLRLIPGDAHAASEGAQTAETDK
jgi:hypothetical protein